MIITTGASSGIGGQCAIIWGELEANILIVGRNKKRLQKKFGKGHMQIQ
jgi:short-subunit dehydrogenase